MSRIMDGNPAHLSLPELSPSAKVGCIATKGIYTGCSSRKHARTSSTATSLPIKRAQSSNGLGETPIRALWPASRTWWEIALRMITPEGYDHVIDRLVSLAETYDQMEAAGQEALSWNHATVPGRNVFGKYLSSGNDKRLAGSSNAVLLEQLQKAIEDWRGAKGGQDGELDPQFLHQTTALPPAKTLYKTSVDNNTLQQEILAAEFHFRQNDSCDSGRETLEQLKEIKRQQMAQAVKRPKSADSCDGSSRDIDDGQIRPPKTSPRRPWSAFKWRGANEKKAMLARHRMFLENLIIERQAMDLASTLEVLSLDKKSEKEIASSKKLERRMQKKCALWKCPGPTSPSTKQQTSASLGPRSISSRKAVAVASTAASMPPNRHLEIDDLEVDAIQEWKTLKQNLKRGRSQSTSVIFDRSSETTPISTPEPFKARAFFDANCYDALPLRSRAKTDAASYPKSRRDSIPLNVSKGIRKHHDGQSQGSYNQQSFKEHGHSKRSDGKRRSRDDTNEDSEDVGGGGSGGGSGKRPKRNASPGGSGSDEQRKLACPYFKRNPRRYLKFGSCCGPGWDTVHRLKEHLYRRHALPILCPRCFGAFKDTAALSEHLRSQLGCEVKQSPQVEGFDIAQEKLLRSRKKVTAKQSEEDKWKDVYRILFPDDDPSQMPSPYYDYDCLMEGRPSQEDELMRYESFMNRELPTQVVSEIETALEEEFGPIQSQLKQRLETIVRSCHGKLSNMYNRSYDPFYSPPEVPSESEISNWNPSVATENKPLPLLPSFIPIEIQESRRSSASSLPSHHSTPPLLEEYIYLPECSTQATVPHNADYPSDANGASQPCSQPQHPSMYPTENADRAMDDWTLFSHSDFSLSPDVNLGVGMTVSTTAPTAQEVVLPRKHEQNKWLGGRDGRDRTRQRGQNNEGNDVFWDFV